MSAIVIENLKQKIESIEHGSIREAYNNSFTTGSVDFDNIFPSYGLAKGTLLEVLPKTYKQRSSAIGAVLAILARLLCDKAGPVIWCQLRDPERLHLHAPGLAAFGIDPSRIIKLTLKSEQDLLWAMEEALDCPYVSGVVGVLWGEKLYNFTASKRLSMRAKESGVSALMLRSHRANGTTAADMRWQISADESSMMPKRRAFLPRLGRTLWQLDIVKCKGANVGTWHIGWNHETVSFDLASRLVDRTHLSQIPPNASQRRVS